MFIVRLATPDDAEGILHAHHSAVHETAKKDYSQAILNVWSGPVDAQRIAAHRTKLQADKGVISFVAVEESGKILGFTELVFPDELRAMYIASSAGRLGVASSLYKILESKARELGMKQLKIVSSLTAAPFYVKQGFRELSRGVHVLSARLPMACVHMEKKL